jgi:hypothetical protein
MQPESKTTILPVPDILKRLDSFIEHNDVGTIFPTAYKQVETVSSNSAWESMFWRDGKCFVQKTKVAGSGTSAQAFIEVRRI